MTTYAAGSNYYQCLLKQKIQANTVCRLFLQYLRKINSRERAECPEFVVIEMNVARYGPLQQDMTITPVSDDLDDNTKYLQRMPL